MPVSYYLNKIALSELSSLTTLVENRRVFNLKHCELNVFESYTQAYRVPLTFNEFVITSMVRGKKIMHLHNRPSFEYMPGETVILPANDTMVIDFPEAETANPSQCIALTVDRQYINNTLNFLNEYYDSPGDVPREWKLQFDKYHFNNDNEVTDLINKLMRVCSGSDRTKDIFADLNVKELLIRLLQTQQLVSTATEAEKNGNKGRMHFVLHYIHEHLTGKILVDDLCRRAYLSRNAFFKWFKQQFGITPVDYINIERIKLAKQLLANEKMNVAQVSYNCGFSDLNYFIRIFKKVEGITPGTYRNCLQGHFEIGHNTA